jgi:hypothetical protein
MIFRQITHDDLGCASYLVGDEDAGVAAVVDPKLDVEEYLALARYMGGSGCATLTARPSSTRRTSTRTATST